MNLARLEEIAEAIEKGHCMDLSDRSPVFRHFGALLRVARAAQESLAWFDSQQPNGGGVCREELRAALAALGEVK